MAIPVTGLYAGLFALMLVTLSMRISRMRESKGIELLTGDDAEMARAVRAHGNFIEYVPLLLVLMAAMELNGIAPYVIHLFGTLMLVSRIAHVSALRRSSKMGKLRVMAMLGTFAALILAGLTAISSIFQM